jgi:hypothetical protein
MSLSRAIPLRLSADRPIEVAFKKVTYRLAIAQVPVSGMWQPPYQQTVF